jgi:hypothetical protein
MLRCCWQNLLSLQPRTCLVKRSSICMSTCPVPRACVEQPWIAMASPEYCLVLKLSWRSQIAIHLRCQCYSCADLPVALLLVAVPQLRWSEYQASCRPLSNACRMIRTVASRLTHHARCLASSQPSCAWTQQPRAYGLRAAAARSCRCDAWHHKVFMGSLGSSRPLYSVHVQQSAFASHHNELARSRSPCGLHQHCAVIPSGCACSSCMTQVAASARATAVPPCVNEHAMCVHSRVSTLHPLRTFRWAVCFRHPVLA